MPPQKYREIKIRMAGIALIKQVNAIIAEYNKAGYSLTLRQVYYQLVARGVIPNNERSYKNVGELISNGRLAGLIDWNAIEDRTRYIRALPHWNTPGDIIASAAGQYRINKWDTQPNYTEVWVEKDALIGVIEQVARRYDVPCFSCRGYTSQSEMWHAAQRLQTASTGGARPITIIHLGDHDPSGIDMTRDIEDRLNEFGQGQFSLEIKRIALNMDQVEQYNPPPNPAKITDSRAEGYIKIHGESSWELDALNPKILDTLIEGEINDLIDFDLFEKAEKREAEEKATLQHAEEFVRFPGNFQRAEKGPTEQWQGGGV
jgi:hypothetical protein